MTAVFLIARTVILEAIRRREVYAIILATSLAIGAIGSIRFFNIPELGKFYHEIALKIMGLASTVTVIILGARQLPREFEHRTIYTLLARPIHRGQFLAGKFLGVMGAGVFCYLLFTVVFLCGCVYLRARIYPGLLAQHLYLQVWMLAVVSSLAFTLSLLGNLDMAVTVSLLAYVLSSLFTAALTYLYNFMGAGMRGVLKIINYTVPQLALFDLSGKVVHGEVWQPIPAWVIAVLTAYGAVYVGVFLSIGYLLFRRRAL